MMIVYGFGSAVGMGTGVSGHSAMALAGLGGNSIYISWIRSGNTPWLKEFKAGSFGQPTYRVQIPTNEDGPRTGVSEEKAYKWFFNELLPEAYEKRDDNLTIPVLRPDLPRAPAKKEGAELTSQELRTKNFLENKRDLRKEVGGDYLIKKLSVSSREFEPLYLKYNCADICEKLLQASGAYDISSLWMATFTPLGIVRDAKSIRRAAIRKGGITDVSPGGQDDKGPEGFFKDDTKKNRNIEPWPL